MRLWLAPTFIVFPAVGALIGSHSAIAGVAGRNDSYFGDLTLFERFFGGFFGAISGGVLGFLLALFTWAIVLAVDGAREYDDFAPLVSGGWRWPKAFYVLRWPVILFLAVMISPYLCAQALHLALGNTSRPVAPSVRVPVPAPTFTSVLPDQQAETRRAQFEVPKLLGDWFYPGAQIWPCSQPRPLVPHSMIMLLTKDTLTSVITYYAARLTSLDKSALPTRFVGRAPRPGDGRDTFVSVNQKGDFVFIQFSTS